MNHKPDQPEPIPPQPVLDYSNLPPKPLAPTKWKLAYQTIMFFLAMVFVLCFFMFLLDLMYFHD